MVVGFGGYVSTPAYLAARRRGVPIVVHEANARPGVANRLGARLTRDVAVAFPGTPLRGAQVLGMPLRRQITDLDRAALRARPPGAAFGLGTGPDHAAGHRWLPGGAAAQRHLRCRGAPTWRAAGVQVLHVSGRGKGGGRRRRQAGRTPPYVVLDYLDRMDLGYAAADVVVCRAGAGTVCELTSLGLPAAYVPLPIGNGEQRLQRAAGGRRRRRPAGRRRRPAPRTGCAAR